MTDQEKSLQLYIKALSEKIETTRSVKKANQMILELVRMEGLLERVQDKEQG